MQSAIPCMVMRGGTSKGLYFLASDLPEEKRARNQLLLSAMGSPDHRQIDGLGGAHPLTSKVAIVSLSTDPDCDVDYLFQQVMVDRPEVSGTQNCGNILAGVGPFAIERGLVAATESLTNVRIRMLNTGARAIARVRTRDGRVEYAGDVRVDGVPGTAAPVRIDFVDIEGSSCGALLPTSNVIDCINGTQITCIDNGMPVVLLRASDFGLSGSESPSELEANASLQQRVEAMRIAVGPIMGLGDVRGKTVPKMCLVSPPVNGGTINTRTFIPHRVHEAIGVLGSVSVATACAIPGSLAQKMVGTPLSSGAVSMEVEHPTGYFTVELDVSAVDREGRVSVRRAGLVRTARLLMRGEVMVAQHPSESTQ